MEFHEFVTRRLESFRRAPHMWGSNEVLEASAITLLECEVQHYAPEFIHERPRVVLEAFTNELRKRQHLPSRPLSSPQQELKRPFEFELFDVCHAVRHQIGAEALIWGPEGKAKHSLRGA